MKHTFTFVVNFRGGTYCSQVLAKDINSSLKEWLNKIRTEKSEIKHLGENTLINLENEIRDNDTSPVALTGLHNIWFTILSSKMGPFHINIIQTDIKKQNEHEMARHRKELKR